MRNLILVAILVLARQGSSEPTAVTAPTAPAPTAGSDASAAAGDGAEPTVLGECSDGMVMQPGKGCSYEGEEGRPVDIVISVGADGSICREKGSVMMSGFMVGVNHVCAEEYAVIDILEAEINFAANGDRSWTVTTSK